ncbi:purine-cytosine permease-like transporter [Singulisphaera sp. PoT]|uniref:purine-cytosine permease-like transporter n=1 Tax=Singulisphaera sp. PoT TaxID=3411797 RepID=UPI003BF5EE90
MDTAEGALSKSPENHDTPAVTAESATATPPLVRKPWQTSIAPTFISLFLWMVYFDQLGRRALPLGGLIWCVIGAAAGGLLCYLLLYYGPAMWGQRTGFATEVLGTDTFGERGAPWFTHLLVGIVQVVWMAVSAHYATSWSLQGLVSIGLLPAHALQPVVLDSMKLPSILFLITSLTWLYAAALVGRYLLRVILALMNVYPVFPALSLGLATLVTLKGAMGTPIGEGIQPVLAPLNPQGRLEAFTLVIQWIFGFFACSATAAADWGATSRSPKDVRIGGLVGVFMASWIVATLGLLVTSGGAARAGGVLPQGVGGQPSIEATFQNALLLGGFPPWLAGAVFLLFGLSALAPACYGAFILGSRFNAVWPSWPRLRFILLATPVAWLISITRFPTRLEEIFTVMGALFGPMLGVLAAGYLRSRGVWPGARRGVNPAGVLAWALGLFVGLVPLVGKALDNASLAKIQPAAVLGFVVAYAFYYILATFGLEAPPAEVKVETTIPAAKDAVVATTPDEQAD